MSFYNQAIIAAVDAVAHVHYINGATAKQWNQTRGDDLRLVSGWSWTAKNRSMYQQGLKTVSAAYRDAWYRLVQQQQVPRVGRTRLKVVRKAA